MRLGSEPVEVRANVNVGRNERVRIGMIGVHPHRDLAPTRVAHQYLSDDMSDVDCNLSLLAWCISTCQQLGLVREVLTPLGEIPVTKV